MSWNFEYEVEVEVEEPEYEIEVEYDAGYAPEYEIEVDYDSGYGYHNEPEVEIEIEYDDGHWNQSGGGGGYGQGYGMGNHMGGFGPGQKHALNANFSTSGWQSWGAKNSHNQQNWNVGWTGWFAQGGTKNVMNFQNFQVDLNGNIWGHGNDAVGNFNIGGKMNNNGHFKFNKQYVGAHCVVYSGQQKGVYLAGRWDIPGNCNGTFQIKCNAPRWSGCFWQNGQRTNMALDMDVSQWGVSGHGSDSVGAFNIRGECHGNVVSFAKQYWGQHTVFYQGQMKGNNINGFWQIPNNCSGKFQLHRG